ncbi:hypothetical protein MX572_26025 (plasmid) [Rhodococcus pyridinivorans]|uniref:hypothetical protein n=1 Tax=Rhodococcus pyridinivorans TaxID=103816 RepID=UPI0020C734BD|nr:hypothetical protein [Rhodococcus pyridinivorans]UTM40108.1 hypothetical protein MX572_26025 [Rhodococcus pyridinivorans]
MTDAVTASTRDELVSLLTLERLAPYLRESDGNIDLALDLYSWNAAIAAASMEVVAYIEVMLRNAVDRELSRYAHEEQRKLPWFLVPSITGESHDAISKSIEATRTRLRGLSAHRDSRDQIIAGLSFGFWTELFGSKHEDLWRAALSNALPGTPAGRRKNVTAKLERLRPFRNRLAHHDSLLSQDVLFQLEEMLTLAEWMSPGARTWLERHEKVSDLYRQRPVTPIDTLVVPATEAWHLYENNGIYICPAGRNFRPSTYLAFYANKEIKPTIAQILYHRDNVEWTTTEAARLSTLAGDANKNDRKIAAAITASRAAGWTGGRYQIFLLSRIGDPRTIELKAAIPHLHSGRGSAFVQRHRYVSHHSLQSAKDTSDVK